MSTAETSFHVGKLANGKRRHLLAAMTGAILLAATASIAWWGLFFRHAESTDDAYVAGNMVQVSSQISGTVLSIAAADTELVQAGVPLVELDPADARVALEQAEAQLAQAVRDTRTLFINNGSLSANIALRNVEVERARGDLARRQELVEAGAVSWEDVEHAHNALRAAEASLHAARAQLSANLALTDDTSVAEHPGVKRAASQVRAAWLSFVRTTVSAPVTGYVARRSVQVGQHVAAGTPLLSVVPLDTVWVDANFKEDQLVRMRIGQPATLRSDLYGSAVVFHGKVSGLSAGTGSAFALLPAQNATGNWVKVVQRVPVRIALDPKSLQAHPLRIGVSMQVNVDVAHEGAPLSAGSYMRPTSVYRTRVFDDAAREVEERIEHIIEKNRGDRGA